MVNEVFFTINFVGTGVKQEFNCRREEIKSTIEMLKEYNNDFKLIKVSPWRLELC